MTNETRRNLKLLVDQHTRTVNQPRERVLAPRSYTRCKTEEERKERRRVAWRAYYWRNREARCEAQRARDTQKRLAA